MTAFATSRAVVIGIDAYQHGIAPLRSPVADARAVGEALATAHGFEVEQIADGQATLAGLRAWLSGLRSRVGPDDRLLVYFAGHGIALDGDDGPQGFLVPADARAEARETLLPMMELHDALLALPCRHLLLVLDCCFAGSFRWATTRSFRPVERKLYQRRFARFQSDPAWQVLTSAAHDQEALDVVSGLRANHRDAGALGGPAGADATLHSPFAQALLEGLAGAADLAGPDGERDGVITASELYLYLRERVELGAGALQTPGLWPLRRHGRGEFVFHVPGQSPRLAPDPVLDDAANPWRGLQAYGASDVDLYFGRRAAVEALREKALGAPLTVVLAASGAGKSSLVNAGLIAWVAAEHADWTVVGPLRPGAEPVSALADVAATCDGPRLVVIDQAEEIFTLCRDPAAREAFVARLIALLAQPDTHVVLTARIEFEPQLATTLLGPRLGEARFIVAPPGADDLRQIIEGPAAARVLYFEPPTLVDQLIDEVIAVPGGLPLLSFTLSEMYRHAIARGADDRSLTAADYAAVGGVVGSLRQRAGALVDELDEAARQTARRLVLRMVATDGGELARRRASLAELTYDDPLENQRMTRVLDAFTDARLLVRGTGGVEPAHDTLILAWDRVHGWLDAAAETLPLQRAAWREATAWAARGEPAGLLWSGDPRLPAVDALGPALNSLERRFVGASRRRARRRKWVGVGVVTAIVAVLAAAAIISFQLYVDAEAGRQQLAVEGAADQHRLALLADARGAVIEAQAHATAAVAQTPPGAPQRARYLRHAALLGQRGPASHVQIAQDGLAFADVSLDGGRAVTVGRDGDVAVVDLAAPDAPVDVGVRLQPPYYTPALSRDGRMLALFDGDALKVIELETSAAVVVVAASTPLPEAPGALQFSASGQTLQLNVRGRDRVLWNVGSTPLRRTRIEAYIDADDTRAIDARGRVMTLRGAAPDDQILLCDPDASRLNALRPAAEVAANPCPDQYVQSAHLLASGEVAVVFGDKRMSDGDVPEVHVGVWVRGQPDVIGQIPPTVIGTPAAVGILDARMPAGEPADLQILTVDRVAFFDAVLGNLDEDRMSETWRVWGPTIPTGTAVLNVTLPGDTAGWFAGDGRTVATLSTRALGVWDGHARARLSHPFVSPSEVVGRAANGDEVAIADAEGWLSRWTLGSRAEAAVGTLGHAFEALAIAGDGAVWAVTPSQQLVRWRAGAATFLADAPRDVSAIGASHADERVAIVARGAVWRYDAAAGWVGETALPATQDPRRPTVQVRADGHVVVAHTGYVVVVDPGVGLRKTCTPTGFDAPPLTRDATAFGTLRPRISGLATTEWRAVEGCQLVPPQASDAPERLRAWQQRAPASDRGPGTVLDEAGGYALVKHHRRSYSVGELGERFVTWLRVWDVAAGVPFTDRLAVGLDLAAARLVQNGTSAVAVTRDGAVYRWPLVAERGE